MLHLVLGVGVFSLLPILLRNAPDTFNFLRHVMRAILSVRPKCSHRCVSLKENPSKPCANPQAHNQKLNRANSYENEMVQTYRNLNCSGASPNCELWGFLVSQHGQLGAISPVLSVSPLGTHVKWTPGVIVLYKRGISAIFARYPLKTRQNLGSVFGRADFPQIFFEPAGFFRGFLSPDLFSSFLW